MSSRRVWYRLVDTDGNAFRGTGVDSTLLPMIISDGFSLLTDLRCAIFERNSNILDEFVPSQLSVYGCREDLLNLVDAIAEDCPVGEELGMTKDSAVYVLVPTCEESAPGRKRRQACPLLAVTAQKQPMTTGIPCNVPFYCNVANFIEQAGGWIECSHDIPSTRISRFLARESYNIIAEQLLQDNDDRLLKKAIITGTPGIGKSLFLVYLLHKLVKQRKRVLFIYHPLIVYFDSQGGVYELVELPPNTDHEMWSRDLWCLFDAKAKSDTHLDDLPYNDCCFVVSTSPKRSMINDFKKPPTPTVFYMPLWTKAEMNTIAGLYADSANDDQWEQRFCDLGGIPRFVFEDIRESPQAILQNACLQCNLDDCTKIIGLDSNITDKNKVVHALVHISSTAPYQKCSVQYASHTALLTIVRLKKMEARRHMQSLLESCMGINHVASLCGYIFEDYALELLQSGGSFTCRELFDGRKKHPSMGSTRLIVAPSETRINAAEIQETQIERQLYVPIDRSNFTAVDAWIPGIGAFQMTVSRDHVIRGDTEQKLKLLGDKSAILYWLLPPPHFDKFTRKEPHALKQFAVLIPYPTMISPAQ